MEYEKIKQLIEDVGNSKLTSIDIEFKDGTKIKMEKNNEVQEIVKTVATSEFQEVKNETKDSSEKIESDGNIVKSPMVGTFYIKPSPEATPYVEIGTDVKKGTVLCIVEAMKLMNEIESEFDGKISEIYVKDGETVQYGKPIFKII